MPTFDTPTPISATIDLGLGDVRITAGDRATPSSTCARATRPTTATPAPPSRPGSTSRTASCWSRRRSCASGCPAADGGSIDVTVELPAGSSINGTAGSADFRCDGRLGTCRIKIGLGTIEVDEAGSLHLRAAAGDITVDHATGAAELTAGSGELRVRELDGGAVIKNSNGDTWVGDVAGEVRLNAANGNIAVDVANAGVVAKTANGDVRLGEVVRGSVALETQMGDVEVGIREGTAAWLDVNARAGKVHNALDAADAPATSAETVEVRARTSVGNIVIRRRPGHRKGHRCHIRDHGGRPAQVVRRPARARRRRPRRRRGHDLRAARPERGGQDHDRADPVDPDRRRRRRASGSPATTSPREPDAVRAAIGVTGQFSAVDNLLTGRENLMLMADLHHLGRRRAGGAPRDLLERFDLVDAAGKPAVTYSGGMRRRLDLAMTPGRRPADHLPRRADHRPGPAQPPHHVGHHPRPRRRAA